MPIEALRQIQDELTEMETLARQTLSGIDPFVEEIVRYSFQFGGKRLRPAILLLSGKAVGKVTEKHIRMATAVEFVHTATLIHDDILDGASVRRHLETVNVKWNAQIGVLAGDILLTRALEILTQDDEMFGLRQLTQACKRTCEGELVQIGAAGHFKMTLDEYYRIIAGKTAPLLACSAELGAYYAGAAQQTVEMFRRFGEQLGLAFQMIDDILDIDGTTEITGKTLRTDLLNRKPTLPLILFLQNASAQKSKEIEEQLQNTASDETAVQKIVDAVHQSGAVEQSRKIAADTIQKATDSIAGFGDSGAIAGLISIARFVGNRKH